MEIHTAAGVLDVNDSGATVYAANRLNQYTSRSVGVSPTLNPLYDNDGNATAYPLPVAPSTNSTLTWDAENRLTSSTVNSVTTTYFYDAQSRRVAQTTGGKSTLYFYDGFNCIADYSIQNSTFSMQHFYLWGMDLSGKMQGAGGVGGLLSLRLLSPAALILQPSSSLAPSRHAPRTILRRRDSSSL